MATSNFEKVGDEGIVSHVVNLSGERRPYTIPVPKKGPKGADIPGRGAKGDRGSSVIHEAHGPTFRPVAKICYPTSGDVGESQRNVKTVPGGAGFWGKRLEGPRIG
jgi:hypothetical protein